MDNLPIVHVSEWEAGGTKTQEERYEPPLAGGEGAVVLIGCGDGKGPTEAEVPVAGVCESAK
jgi:hypothetical protein